MIQAGIYEIRFNEAGEMLFILFPPEGGYEGLVESPEIAYDGGEHAILYRNADNPIVIDYVPSEARTPLSEAKAVRVAECKDGSFLRDYEARIIKIGKIPGVKADIIDADGLAEALEKAGILPKD